MSTVSFMMGGADELLAELPATFSYSQARAGGVGDRRLYGWRDGGVIEQLGRGLYRRTDHGVDGDVDLIEIGSRAADATLCLTTALVRHGLSDAIPARLDVALPRGRRHPRTVAPVRWHTFAADTFEVGRLELRVGGGVVLGVYGPERCIIDAFRLRHLEGPEVAVEALRRWLRRRGAQPAALLVMARTFPKAEPGLRSALQVLL